MEEIKQKDLNLVTLELKKVPICCDTQNQKTYLYFNEVEYPVRKAKNGDFFIVARDEDALACFKDDAVYHTDVKTLEAGWNVGCKVTKEVTFSTSGSVFSYEDLILRRVYINSITRKIVVEKTHEI